MSQTETLLEREGELAALGSQLEAARAGVGSLTIVEGPAGIGKTRLLEAICSDARAQGMQALAARGAELEAEYAFGVVRQLFEFVLRASAAGQRDALLEGAAGLARPALLAELPRPGADPVFATLHGLFWLCVNLAERAPVAVLVDDAQWADAPSLRFLNYLARRLDGLAIGVVLGLRAGEPRASGELVSTLADDPSASVLRPAALSESAVAKLVAVELRESPEPEFCRACHAVTGGNPFLLRELLHAMRYEGTAPTAEASARVADFVPRGVARSVLVRISRISDSAGALARALAILGDDCELRIAARLAELDEPAGACAADLLRAAEILRPSRELKFVHPIIRSAIYTDVPHAQRSLLHAKAARVLDEARASSGRVAAQLLETDAADDSWTAAVLRSAAREAIDRGAPDNAVACLSRALLEAPSSAERPDVLHELGTAEILSNRPAAIDHLREALDGTVDPALRAATAQQLATALALLWDKPQAAIGVLDKALAELAPDDRHLSARMESYLLTIAAATPVTRALVDPLLAGVRRRTLGDSPSERLLLASLAFYYMAEGRPADQVRATAERALGGGLLPEVSGEYWIFYGLISALIFADQFELADSWLARAVAEAQAHGSVFEFASASAFRASVAYRTGNLVQAEAEGRAALEAAGPSSTLVVNVALLPLLDTLIDRGEFAAGERLAIGDAAQSFAHEGMTYQLALVARGRLRVAQGRVQQGLADLLSVGRWCEAWGALNPGMFACQSSAALAALTLGDVSEARRLAREEVHLARPLGQPRALGMALRAAGLAEGGRPGIVLLYEAVEVLERSLARLEHARALTDLGSALRRDGQRAAAREPLRLALDLAHRCDAGALVERAHQELLATGARPRRLMVTGRDALTPTEARIARMAAEGRTTPAIAQALFITPKTVETHLGHAYQKLDINSRHDLAQALQ
jgi:DNA-binding CsgD family transcriptional regulator